MSLASRVVPGSSKRTDFPLMGDRCALLIIDVQKYLSLPRSSAEAANKSYFFEQACPAALQNIQKLTEAFRLVRDDPMASRKSAYEVIFTYLQSGTRDGRDISLDYKLSGPDLSNIPDVHTEPRDIFLDALPADTSTGKGDILLPKTSCNVFVSTRIDYMLRNLGIEQLVIVGQLTDECVESAVRSAADLGYFVTVVEDACASMTPEKHQKGLDGVKGFARILKTADLLDEVVEGIVAEMDGTSGHSKSALSTGVNDDSVLAYLRSKGLHKVAKQLSMMFTIQGLSKRDKKDDKKKSEEEKKDEDTRQPRPPRSPRRKVKPHAQNNSRGQNRGDSSDGEDTLTSRDTLNSRPISSDKSAGEEKGKDLDGSLTFLDLEDKKQDGDAGPASRSPPRSPPRPSDPPTSASMPSLPLTQSPKNNTQSPKRNKTKRFHDSDRLDAV